MTTPSTNDSSGRPNLDGTSTVAVRGTASVEHTPDHVEISVAATTTAPDAAGAAAALDPIVAQLRALDVAGLRSVNLPAARTSVVRHWDDTTGAYVDDGWQATIAGTVTADADAAGRAAAAIIDTGASISYLHWDLDDRAGAVRQARIGAVTRAREAAEDFAAALDGTLGPLVTLADPGLASAGSERFAAFGAPMAASRAPDGASAALDLDPALIEVHATVEAVYRVDR